MKPKYQLILDAVANSVLQDNIEVAALQKQIDNWKAAARIVTISQIQAVMPETLWYEARDSSAPKSGPHGTVIIIPGSPATVDFRPVRLAGGSSDNCYNLRRLYPTLTTAQRAVLETATNFSLGCDYLLDPLASVQAAELDYQIRKSNGVVINVGLQIRPDGTSWQVMGFDFVTKSWQPVGAKITPKSATLIHVEVSATCDDKIVQFTQVKVDGIVTSISFRHPVSQSVTGSPYINCAYQLDATGDAKPYHATVDNLQVSFG